MVHVRDIIPVIVIDIYIYIQGLQLYMFLLGNLFLIFLKICLNFLTNDIIFWYFQSYDHKDI